MTTEPELIKQVALGLDAEAFLNTSLGKYLVTRAEEMIAGARDALETVAPEDTEKIRALQNQCTVGREVQYWLAEVITAGQAAEREIAPNVD